MLKKHLQICPNVLGKIESLNTAILVLLACLEGEYHFIFQNRGPHVRQSGEGSFSGGAFQPGSWPTS
ncbi:MAG: NTP pyrophosphohydrolase [Nitrospirae bacterium]|nr:MAG: NTP pyrophosphohydrolase [Nitrospirota bacterium]